MIGSWPFILELNTHENMICMHKKSLPCYFGGIFYKFSVNGRLCGQELCTKSLKDFVSSLSHTYNGCGENKRIIIRLANKVFINFQGMSHKTKSNTEKFKHKSSNLRIQNSICQIENK